LEGCTTQEEIEHSTLLPRSTVSEMLNQAINRGVIIVTKKEGSRIKYYKPSIPFSDLMLSYFDRVAQYISTMKQKLSSFAKEVDKLHLKNEKAKEFQNFIDSLLEGYELSHILSENMKVEVVKQLKHEFEQGFQFI
jgi:DNA-binding transcriptional regulator GbsR (MarR family)